MNLNISSAKVLKSFNKSLDFSIGPLRKAMEMVGEVANTIMFKALKKLNCVSNIQLTKCFHLFLQIISFWIYKQQTKKAYLLIMILGNKKSNNKNKNCIYIQISKFNKCYILLINFHFNNYNLLNKMNLYLRITLLCIKFLKITVKKLIK